MLSRTFTIEIMSDAGCTATLGDIVPTLFPGTVAHYGGGSTARDRLHSNAIWALVVFLLNVLAFPTFTHGFVLLASPGDHSGF